MVSFRGQVCLGPWVWGKIKRSNHWALWLCHRLRAREIQKRVSRAEDALVAGQRRRRASVAAQLASSVASIEAQVGSRVCYSRGAVGRPCAPAIRAGAPKPALRRLPSVSRVRACCPLVFVFVGLAQFMAINWIAVFRSCFLIMFLAYPGVSLKVLRIFQCRTIDGVAYLEADMRLQVRGRVGRACRCSMRASYGDSVDACAMTGCMCVRERASALQVSGWATPFTALS